MLNLGTLELAKDKWTELAQRVEDLISGQKRLLPCATEIERLAQHYVKLYVRQQLAVTKDIDERQHDFQSVEVNAILDQRSLTTPPKSLLGRAISYALNQWERLVRYTEDGRFRPDNNLVENAIWPFALGRKNWLFAGHPNGAKAGALFFSLIETAKAEQLGTQRLPALSL